MSRPYFRRFDHREPPSRPPLSARRERLWHCLAGLTIGTGFAYLWWRWTVSLNPEAILFSAIVATAETLAFAGTLLFFHDIWREGDTPETLPPACRADLQLDAEGPVLIDVFITTFDEEISVLIPSVAAARALRVPQGCAVEIHLLDDGNRPAVARLARRMGVGYITRTRNTGYKAGNIRNAMFRTRGDFIVICDADTRVLPGFVENTIGYFRDPRVAWVQTPHWFYDIPEGVPVSSFLQTRFGPAGRMLAPLVRHLAGGDRIGSDPLMSNPDVFFDVIQRRRNRNGASFCCGAGSIHRREALFRSALQLQARDARMLARAARPGWRVRLIRWLRDPRGRASHTAPGAAAFLPATTLQPFRFHVSEDILTSIAEHSDDLSGWRSVYHPRIECRMLSPWSTEAWAIQRLKYAGGTFDIMLRENPLFRRGMPWRIKLHYASTFWSYLSILWMPVLLFAPAVALVTGFSPVGAPTAEFFARLVPLLLLNEAALAVTCKGHDIHQGRQMAVSLLPIHWRALLSVLRGQRPRFPTTPKTPGGTASLARLGPNLAILAILAAAAAFGIAAWASGSERYDPSLIATNLFWLAWNALAVGRIVTGALLFRSASEAPTETPENRVNDHHAPSHA